MSERRALILGSAVAAWCVASAAVFFAKAMRWIRPGDFDFATVQVRVVLPAMLAVAASAWWCTRKRYFKPGETASMAGGITLLSYLFLSLIIFLASTVSALLGDSFANHGVAETLLYGLVTAGIVAVVGFVVTATPAFAVEYLLVRFLHNHFDTAAKKEVLR